MADPLSTRHDPVADTAADLAAEGFDDAHTVGRGGFGVVYRCRQTALDRTVAIKILTSDLSEENRQRFLREQRAMGRLSGHPNIVEILQTGVTRSGHPYIVMPFHAHSSLDARVRSQGPVSWREALRIGVKTAGALETAHRLGMLHRDVKPANILFTDYGEPQLCDFGIARVEGGFETRAGDVVGSPAFTAPEVLRGEQPTPASDLYGLGATLFSIVTGHAAFERRSGEQIVSQFLRITTEPIPDLREDGIPDLLSAAIEKAMSENPSDRFTSAREFGDELRSIEQQHGIEVDSMALPSDDTGGSVEPHPRPSTSSGPFARTGSSTSEGRRRTSGITTPPSVATKYRPPTPTHALVPRTHVLDILRSGQRRRLALLHAPPGFGKTTVAAQWRDVLVAEGVPVAWIGIDRDDDNVVWFLAHLIEAIRTVAPSLAQELGEILENHGDDAERYVLTSLVNEIHQQRIHLVVVIDDWHIVSDPATIDALAFLLENSCHHLQVVVTSRTKSGLPIGTLRVLDEFVEIDAAALRFDATETRRLLDELGGTPLSERDVARLEETTDGWVAALQLVGVSLRGRDDPSDLIGGLTGRHHAIGQYLAENVIGSLDTDLLDFILAVSIPTRVCAGLAAALTGVDRPQAMLEEVEERDLFFHALDDEREWFRFDTLFAEFLRRRLSRDRRDRVDELHRIAARWFDEHHMLSDAVDHAVAAHDDELAAELVEAHSAYLLEHSRMTAVLCLVSKLSPALVAARPRLQLALAWANILLQRPGAARTAITTLEAILHRSRDPDVAGLRTETDVARAVIEAAADRASGVSALIAPVLEQPDTVRPWVASAAANVSSLVAILEFDFAEARRRQDWAATFHHRTTGSFGLVYGHCFAGVAATEQLDIAAAEDHFRNAVQAAEASSGARSHSARLAGAMLGGLLYELGDIDEAERLFDAGHELGHEGGAVDFMIARYVTGARIKALRGDAEAATKHLDDGLAAAEALTLPRLRARVENERVHLRLPSAPGRPARSVTGPNRMPVGPGADLIVEELEEDSELTGLQVTDPAAALRRAAARVTATDEQRRPLAHLRTRRVLATCQIADERTDEAAATVAAIAAVCAGIGFTRFLVDGGPVIVDVLARLHDAALAHEWRPEWQRVPVEYLAATLQPVERS